jgi:hypothetical protein
MLGVLLHRKIFPANPSKVCRLFRINGGNLPSIPKNDPLVTFAKFPHSEAGDHIFSYREKSIHLKVYQPGDRPPLHDKKSF